MIDIDGKGGRLNRAELQIERVRRLLVAPAGMAGGLGDGLEVAGRKAFLPAAQPVAFLAAYNLRPPSAGWPVPTSVPSPFPFPVPLPPPPPSPYLGASKPAVSTVFLLGQGANRIGHDDWGSDFVRPRRASTESRQWLVLIAGDRAFVADDASSSGSFVLRRDAPRLSGQDPRFDAECSGFRREGEEMTALEWPGAEVVELTEGDVLVAIEAPHVFGWIRPRDGASTGGVEEPGAFELGALELPCRRARALLSGSSNVAAGNLPVLEICVERTPANLPTRAFLASFTSGATDIVVPLRDGRNRVGWSMFGGDFRQPSFAAFDESQWIVFVTGSEAWVVALVPAPLTIVLPRGSRSHAELQGEIGDESVRARLLDVPPVDSVVLDKYGRGVRRLVEGDILVTRQAALVFGWLRAATSLDGAES